MPIDDISLNRPKHMERIAIPEYIEQQVEIMELETIDLNCAVARLLLKHFDVACLRHTADLSPQFLEVQFDQATLGSVDARFKLEGGLQQWDPINNEHQFAFAMSSDPSIDSTLSTGFNIESWRRGCLQQLLLNAESRIRGSNVTTVSVPRYIRQPTAHPQ